MVKAIPEHGPDGGLLQTFIPELSIVVTSTTPGPLAVPWVHEPVVATPLTQIEVRVGVGTRLPNTAPVGLRTEGLAATYMSQPMRGAEFWTKTPMVNVEPTGNEPSEGGLEGQLVAAGEAVMQTRPVNGREVTVTAMLTECERLPLIPVTTRVKLVPPATLELTVTVMFELADRPEPTINGFGTYTTETPEGTALLERVTVPLKPPELVAVRISDTDPPDLTDSDVEAATRLKSGGREPVVATVAPRIFSGRVAPTLFVTRRHVVVPLTLLGLQAELEG